MIVEFWYMDKFGAKGEAVQKMDDIPYGQIESTLLRIDRSMKKIEIIEVRAERGKILPKTSKKP